MKICIDEAGGAEHLRRQRVSLPFVNQTVRLDQAGAKFVAWLACRMAVANAGPLETEKQYAFRMASFICGCISAECGSDVQRIRVFTDFLPQTEGYLNRTCSHCRDEASDEEALDKLLAEAGGSEGCGP